jgi:hypothetical protein
MFIHKCIYVIQIFVSLACLLKKSSTHWSLEVSCRCRCRYPLKLGNRTTRLVDNFEQDILDCNECFTCLNSMYLLIYCKTWGHILKTWHSIIICDNVPVRCKWRDSVPYSQSCADNVPVRCKWRDSAPYSQSCADNVPVRRK